MAVGLTIGLLVGQGGSSSPRPVAPTPRTFYGGFRTGSFFQYSPGALLRTVLLTVTRWSPSDRSTSGVRPIHSTDTIKSAGGPLRAGCQRLLLNSNIDADSQFTSYPSTASSNSKLHQDVLLPGTPGEGGRPLCSRPRRPHPQRNRTCPCDIQQWAMGIRSFLTPRGRLSLTDLAEQQFHAILGVVINGQVVSAPITQPTQSLIHVIRWTSSDQRWVHPTPGQCDCWGAVGDEPLKAKSG